jgi:hypothetical protein
MAQLGQDGWHAPAAPAGSETVVLGIVFSFS